MFTRLALPLLLVTLSMLAAPSRAALPPESAWKQLWWDDAAGSWSPLGVILLNVAADRVTAQPVAATYTTRGASLPDGPMTGSITEQEARFSGVFGKRLDPQGNPTSDDRVIEFRLRFADPRTLEGSTFEVGAPAGRTRLVQLADADLLGELEAAAHAWRIEREVVEAARDPLREQQAFLEKQLADDVALGRIGLGNQPTLVLDQTRMQLLADDARLASAREGERLAREMATRLKAQLPAGLVASDPRPPAIAPGESFWSQHWKNPHDGRWLLLGVVHMSETPDAVIVRPISFTYTSRETQLPNQPLRGRRTDSGLSLRGTFGQQPGGGQGDAERVLDFDLAKVGADEFAGVIREGTSTRAETRLVRIADRRQLLDFLEKTELQWGIERAVVMGTIPSLRDQVSALEKQDQSERASGRGGLTPLARINLDHARRSILVEELRLMTTTGGIVGVREMMVRLRRAP